MSILEQVSTNELIKIINESNSLSHVILQLGYKFVTGDLAKKLIERIQKENIDISHFKKKTKKKSIIWILDKIKLIEIIEKSYSFTQVLSHLGYTSFSGHALVNIKERIKIENIDISHFSHKPIYKFTKVPNLKIFIKNSTYCRRSLKKRIIEENLINYMCEICGNVGDWMGHTISLELDHKNGVNNDNRLNNLRFLCPNCHATTPTYSGKNKALKNKAKNNDSNIPETTNSKTIYCCKCCNKKLTKQRKTGLCEDCFKKIEQVKQRKVVRPSYEQLLVDKETMSMLAVGRKYDVSDNSIRKWIKQYELHKTDINMV